MNLRVIKGRCRFPESFCPLQGDGARTSITLDFGDGHALTYSNVSSIEDGIKHIYKAVGIYRVTATGENSLGSETAMLYLHVTCELLLHIDLYRSSLVSIFGCFCFWLLEIASVGSQAVWCHICFISSQNMHSLCHQTNK